MLVVRMVTNNHSSQAAYGHGTLHDAELVALAFLGPSKKLLSEVEVMEFQSGEISYTIASGGLHIIQYLQKSSCMQTRKQHDNSKVVFISHYVTFGSMV